MSSILKCGLPTCNIKSKKKRTQKDGSRCFWIHFLCFGVDWPFPKEWLSQTGSFHVIEMPARWKNRKPQTSFNQSCWRQQLWFHHSISHSIPGRVAASQTSTRTKLVTLKWVRKRIGFTCDRPYPTPETLVLRRIVNSPRRRARRRAWTQCPAFHCTPWTCKFSCTENWHNGIVWVPGAAGGEGPLSTGSVALSIGKSAEWRLLFQDGGRRRV